MRVLFEAVVVCVLLVSLAGCGDGQQDDAPWKDVKIRDLEPSGEGQGPGQRRLAKIGVVANVYEVPAERVDCLEQLWDMVAAGPMRFNDLEAFGANMLSVGFGQAGTWETVAAVLEGAGGRVARRASLLLVDGQANELSVMRLSDTRTIFYVSSGGSAEGVSVGPGMLGLRFKADKVPGLRGVASVRAMPVFVPWGAGSFGPLAEVTRLKPTRFESAGFWLQMGVGDFFVLGRRQFSEGQVRLADYLFNQPRPSRTVRLFLGKGCSDDQEHREPYSGPVVTVYVVFCAGINY